MTIIHEASPISEEPERQHGSFDAFKDLRGRSAEEIRGIIATLFAEDQAHTHPGILQAMYEVQSDTSNADELFAKNTIEAIERVVLDHLNPHRHNATPATGADGGASSSPPEA